jgi:hypothetical protein
MRGQKRALKAFHDFNSNNPTIDEIAASAIAIPDELG